MLITFETLRVKRTPIGTLLGLLCQAILALLLNRKESQN